MAKKSVWAFGPVTDENVDQAIKYVAAGWYAVAVIQGILLTVLAFAGQVSPGDLVDPFAAALGGWFLSTRKSRALAVALFLYSLVILAVTVGAKLGMTQGGTNIFLAIAVVYIGWLGIPATWFWQRRRCAEIRWLPVILIFLAAVIVGLVCIVSAGVVLNLLQGAGRPVPQPVQEFVYAAAMFFPPAFTMALSTMKWPFTEPDASCPWPRKKV